MICETKSYKTRDGRDIIIYAVYENTVHGAIIHHDGCIDVCEWSRKGGRCMLTCESDADLIEVVEEVEYDFWVNVYIDGVDGTYNSRAAADQCKDMGRIACINIKGKGEV